MTEARPLYAIILRLISTFVFTALIVVVKMAGQSGIALPEIMFWRQAGVAILLITWLVATKQVSILATKRPGAHGVRALVGMSNMLCNFGSSMLLPLAVATTLGFTTPLFGVLIAGLILREHVGPWRWGAVLLGFIGVLIVTQPTGEHFPLLGTAMAVSTGLLCALINFSIRGLARTEPSITIVFWFSIIGALLTAPALPFVMTHHTAWQWLLIAFLGILGAIGQTCLTASLRHGQIIGLLVIDYTALVWASLFDWQVWNHLPPITTWLGAPVIILSGIIIAWRESRIKREA